MLSNCVLYFMLLVLCLLLLFILAIFFSTSRKIGCEEFVESNPFCIKWGVKLQKILTQSFSPDLL